MYSFTDLLLRSGPSSCTKTRKVHELVTIDETFQSPSSLEPKYPELPEVKISTPDVFETLNEFRRSDLLIVSSLIFR